MLHGAGIAFVLITVFLISAGEGDPSCPKLWWIKPMLIVPVAGVMGGVFYYFMGHLRYRGGWIKILAIIMNFIGYIIALWLGTVLGLNGTMWD
jgi:hypothetical protein